MFDKIGKWYDDLFGNRDGKFTIQDLPNHAILIVVGVVDVVVAFSEIRVWQVGYELTGSGLLAWGFVAVSALPFYLGQIAYRYNRANNWQLFIAVCLVLMGLFASVYYGFADLIFQANTAIDVNGTLIPINESTLFAVAVGFTVALIVGGLLYVLVDTEIAANLKMNRLQARANRKRTELRIRREVLADLQEVRLQEEALEREYPQDYQAFANAEKGVKNPTNGSGKK